MIFKFLRQKNWSKKNLRRKFYDFSKNFVTKNSSFKNFSGKKFRVVDADIATRKYLILPPLNISMLVRKCDYLSSPVHCFTIDELFLQEGHSQK